MGRLKRRVSTTSALLLLLSNGGYHFIRWSGRVDLQAWSSSQHTAAYRPFVSVVTEWSGFTATLKIGHITISSLRSLRVAT